MMARNSVNWSQIDEEGMRLAIDQARKSYDEGGIPVGSVILAPQDPAHHEAVHPPEGGSKAYRILGKGHNQRIQKASPILHGEMAALEDAGRLKAEIYKLSTIYTTLRIPRVVIGENHTFLGSEDLLRKRGIQVVVKDSLECKELMAKFIRERPKDWNEDIGEEAVPNL